MTPVSVWATRSSSCYKSVLISSLLYSFSYRELLIGWRLIKINNCSHTHSPKMQQREQLLLSFMFKNTSTCKHKQHQVTVDRKWLKKIPNRFSVMSMRRVKAITIKNILSYICWFWRISHFVNLIHQWDCGTEQHRSSWCWLKFTTSTAALCDVILWEWGPEFCIVLVSFSTQWQTGSDLLQILAIAIEHRPRWHYTIKQRQIRLLQICSIWAHFVQKCVQKCQQSESVLYCLGCDILRFNKKKKKKKCIQH